VARTISAERVLDAFRTSTAPLPEPIAVVVAHPDDEVIGVGGQLARWAPHTILIHVTDGAPADGPDVRAAGFATTYDYAAARYGEACAALGRLPHPILRRISLGVTDQQVCARLYEVIAELRDLVCETAPPVVVTHAFEGAHPDHDAIAFGVSAVRAMRHVPPFAVVEFAEYHVNWSDEFVTNRFPRATQDDGRVQLPLDPAAQRLKRLMLACFRTQTRVLTPFHANEEWVRPAPIYDFAAAPPGVQVWYDRQNLGVTSREWSASVADVRARLAAEA
jgi:LmbE family N-acetylglucosaminyl deacetylase